MPLKLEKDNTYHRADGSVVHIGYSGIYPGTSSFTVYKESAASGECWTSGGNNFPGGTIPAKCLTGWVHPAIAARLKAYDALQAGASTALTRAQMADEVVALVRKLAANP